MDQSLPIARLGRQLLAASALCVAGLSTAAVPATGSPFGIEASGNFEPASPLTGGGWQRLAANKQPKSPRALEPVMPATGDIVPAPESPAPVGAQLAAAPTAAAPGRANVPAAPSTWTVSAADGNYRQLIEGWAARAGWTVAPWELEKDLEIAGNDSFQGDFKAAVRRVLEATELTDYQVKPCFHSNNMVRIVKLTTKCDPTQ